MKKIKGNSNKIIKTFELKRMLVYIKKFLIKYKGIIIMSLPFFAMDISTRLFGHSIGFYGVYRLVPNLFTISWIVLLLGIVISFKKTVSKVLYLLFSILFFAMYLVNNIYFSTTSNYFDFVLMESAKEGSPYFMSTLLGANPFIYVVGLFTIFLIVIAYKHIPNNTKNSNSTLGKSFLLFIALHFLCVVFLGTADTDLEWSTWRNPKNIYLSFNDSNKSMRVSGLYEYTVRNFYITFLKTEQEINKENLLFLNQSYEEEKNTKNSYTGNYKNKNIIFLQLEGLDNWTISKETTPTIYKMQNNAINFKNHYSFYNGGGSTFNSEFAVNTGFITPLSYNQNAYTFNKNYFPNSMANIFKDLNYSVNAFHMNTGEYYSRSTNYKNWGYDNYYGLIDMFSYTNDTYKLDRELIENTEFSDLMFNTENRFVDYIITYTPHMPFSNKNGSACKQLLDLDKQEEMLNNSLISTTSTIEEIYTEEDCIKRQIKETDYFLELLLNKLKEKGLYDNTIIVAFADHYLYTIEDKTILDDHKETSNNLINKTPFFIWSSNTKKKNITTVTSQLNILPTVLNLMGIRYNKNNYIGEDALNKNYTDLVFFPDYSWYDGNVYVDGGVVVNNKKISSSKLEEKNYYVSYITKKNDLTLKNDYFKVTNAE